jgi:AbrB family looped-hinge helix DNA binding protein
MKCNDRQVYGTTTVNDKGQVVIPADARKALGIEPDMKMMVIGHAKHKVVVLMPTELFEKKMQGLMGLFFRAEESQ